MQNVDFGKRNFLKACIIFVGIYAVNFCWPIKALSQALSSPSQIGILYSTATGIVLRSINPSSDFPGHLDWLQNNLPAGTTLLRLDKSAVGADDKNMPNLDSLIPYAQKNNAVTLNYGVTCSIVDITNKVVDVVLCCPILYQNFLSSKALPVTLIQKPANIGHIYNPLTQTFKAPVVVSI